MNNTLADLLNGSPVGLYLNGRWENSTTGATFAVLNPANEQFIAHVAVAGPADAGLAMDLIED